MPKLAHKKSRAGCLRCKARKVKCDERQPRCGACTRHGVHCEYERKPVDGKTSTNATPAPDNTTTTQSNGSLLAPPQPNTPTPFSPDNRRLSREVTPSMDRQPPDNNRNLLELRLMHFYITGANNTWLASESFWRVTCPMLGLKHPFLLNAVMALSAFRLAGTIGDPEMRKIAQSYWDRALEGQREALLNITEDNGEAIFATSCLVSGHALIDLKDPQYLSNLGDHKLELDDGDMSKDPVLWLRLAKGSRAIWMHCQEWFRKSETMQALFTEPSAYIRDAEEKIVNEQNRQPFGQILEWAIEYEIITPEDQKAYDVAVCHLGSIYNTIQARTEPALMTGRRIMSMPVLCPLRFIELVEENRPRALVVLAHIFALVKLLDADGGQPRFRGIAESQVPKLYERLPTAWREILAWPMSVAMGTDVAR